MKLLTDDKTFYKKLLAIALPMALRNSITFGLNMLDTIMVGSLGEAPLAAAGVANQPFFVFTLFLFGLTSGAGLMMSQYWGKRDITTINKILGITATVSTIVSLIVTLMVTFMPEMIMGIFSKEPSVIEEGVKYLKIVGPTYLVTSISTIYLSLLLAIEDVKVALKINTLALIINAVLNYIMIFGKLGFPAMGLQGAAIATAISRVIEFVLVIYIATRHGAILKFIPKNLYKFDKPLLKDFAKYSTPVVLNETLWAVGIAMYSVVLGRMGYEVLAAYNIAQIVEKLANVAIYGICDATIVVLGIALGSGVDKEKIYSYAKTIIILGFLCGIVCGGLILLFNGAIFTMYNLDAQTIAYGRQMIIVMACFLPFRAISGINIVGIIRSGGQTQISLLIDLCGLWIFGIPTGTILAFCGFPVMIVYIGFLYDQLVKAVISLLYIRSKKWIKNITLKKL